MSRMEESGQRLENIYQTLPVLASGNPVLQKRFVQHLTFDQTSQFYWWTQQHIFLSLVTKSFIYLFLFFSFLFESLTASNESEIIFIYYFYFYYYLLFIIFIYHFYFYNFFIEIDRLSLPTLDEMPRFRKNRIGFWWWPEDWFLDHVLILLHYKSTLCNSHMLSILHSSKTLVKFYDIDHCSWANELVGGNGLRKVFLYPPLRGRSE